MKQRSLITMVFIVAGLALLGLVLLWPSGSQSPTRASAATAQLQMDFNLADGTGPCNPVTAASPVLVGANFQVGLCLTNYGDAPIGGVLTQVVLGVKYPAALITAPNVASDHNLDLDSNPDWNQAGSTPSVGATWDCNQLNHDAAAPKGNPTPAWIVCATSNSQAATLNGTNPALLATLTFHADAAGGPSAIAYTDTNDDPATVLLPTDSEAVCGWEITCVADQITVVESLPTPTPAGVGGIAELPPLAGASAEEASGPAEGSGWPAGSLPVVAGVSAAAAAVILAGAWYARRRWLR